MQIGISQFGFHILGALAFVIASFTQIGVCRAEENVSWELYHTAPDPDTKQFTYQGNSIKYFDSAVGEAVVSWEPSPPVVLGPGDFTFKLTVQAKSIANSRMVFGIGLKGDFEREPADASVQVESIAGKLEKKSVDVKLKPPAKSEPGAVYRLIIYALFGNSVTFYYHAVPR
jgi:hypothetical protein